MTKGYQSFLDAAGATGLTDRDLVYVAGEVSVGDAGQGHFIYRASGTGSASNDIIVVSAGGRMFRATDPSSAVADQIADAIQGADTPVSVSSLPATAATAANQSLIESAVDAVATAVTAAGANASASAIAAAVDAALRVTPLPVSDVVDTVGVPGGGTSGLPYSLTLTSGSESEVTLSSVFLPRSIGIEPESGDTVRVRYRLISGGTWYVDETSTFTAVTVLQLTSPIYSIGFTRTAGSSVLSRIIIS